MATNNKIKKEMPSALAIHLKDVTIGSKFGLQKSVFQYEKEG